MRIKRKGNSKRDGSGRIEKSEDRKRFKGVLQMKREMESNEKGREEGGRQRKSKGK